MRIKRRTQSESDPVEYYNGDSSMVLSEQFVSNALSHRVRNEYADEPLQVCIGLKNGVLAGSVLWLLIYCIYRVLSL